MSNTRVNILKVRLEQLETEKNLLDNRMHRLRMRKKSEQMLMLGSYFHISNDKFTISVTHDDSVRLKYTGDSYGDIVNYQLDYNWERDEDGERVKTSKIHHNGSTYYELNESILVESQARLEFMQCAIDHNDDIIAAWNTIETKYDKLTQTFNQPSRSLRDSLSSQSKDIEKLEKQALTEKLSGKGVEFVASKGKGYFKGSLPQLEVRYDWNINRIKALKVLRMTPSGKSADLEITQKSDRWDESTKSYIDTDLTSTFSRVRMDKVEQLIISAKRNSQLVG
tara:strand:- start:893 stop:1735 length:843 start_codon:yes stop_codon:yes gene_type:complete